MKTLITLSDGRTLTLDTDERQTERILQAMSKGNWVTVSDVTLNPRYVVSAEVKEP